MAPTVALNEGCRVPFIRINRIIVKLIQIKWRRDQMMDVAKPHLVYGGRSHLSGSGSTTLIFKCACSGTCTFVGFSLDPALIDKSAIMLPQYRELAGFALHCGVPHMRYAYRNDEVKSVIALEYGELSCVL